MHTFWYKLATAVVRRQYMGVVDKIANLSSSRRLLLILLLPPPPSSTCTHLAHHVFLCRFGDFKSIAGTCSLLFYCVVTSLLVPRCPN